MKTDDSKDRLIRLMQKQTDLAKVSAPPPTTSPVVSTASLRSGTIEEGREAEIAPSVKWDRVTIRLTGVELEKINAVVIATQQATRNAKITTTDILRVALRRIKDQAPIEGDEIAALRSRDGRTTDRSRPNRLNVRQ